MQASHLGRALESYRLNTLLSALDDPTDAKIRQFASRVGHKPKHEDLAAYDEFNHVQVSGVFVPDIKRLHRLHKAAFIESVTSVRNDMLAAIEQMQALPTSSQDIGVPSRSEYLSGLKEHMKERSSNLVNRYRRGQKGGLR
jgi:hypothetical protein